MKKIFILLAITSMVVIACDNNKDKKTHGRIDRKNDDYGSRDKENFKNENKWSASDKRAFSADCRKEMAEDIGQDQLDKFCICFLEKFQARFSSYTDFTKKSTHEDGVKVGRECRQELSDAKENPVGDEKKVEGWSEKNVNEYVENCIPGAMESGISRSKAKQYCSCMQQKLQKSYPDIRDLTRKKPQEVEDISLRLVMECVGKDKY